MDWERNPHFLQGKGKHKWERLWRISEEGLPVNSPCHCALIRVPLTCYTSQSDAELVFVCVFKSFVMLSAEPRNHTASGIEQRNKKLPERSYTHWTWSVMLNANDEFSDPRHIIIFLLHCLIKRWGAAFCWQMHSGLLMWYVCAKQLICLLWAHSLAILQSFYILQSGLHTSL